MNVSSCFVCLILFKTASKTGLELVSACLSLPSAVISDKHQGFRFAAVHYGAMSLSPYNQTFRKNRLLMLTPVLTSHVAAWFLPCLYCIFFYNPR